MIEEMEEKLDQKRYYGVAWNYKKDTYRRTGLLANVTKYVDVEDIMFIHNSIEPSPDTRLRCRCKKTYCHNINTETEVIMEISDLPLPGFVLCPLSYLLRVLLYIDYNVYKSFGGNTNPPKHIAGGIEESHLEVTCPICHGKTEAANGKE